MVTTIGGVQYREVTRKAKVGEKIKIVKAYMSGGRYSNGSVLEVTEAVRNLPGHMPHVYVQEGEIKVLDNEYVVLEPVTSADTIDHDGKQYRKVDRPVREGDEYLYITYATGDHFTEGKVYKINTFNGDVPRVTDNDGDNTFITDSKYAILEPVAPKMTQSALSALETELAATKAKVAEMEAQLAEAKQVKVGDYAKVASAPGSLRIGDLVEVLTGDGIFGYRGKRVSDGKIEVFRSGELIRATDEEVSMIQRLKVGDYARVTQVGHSNYGKIVEITKDNRSGSYKYATQHLDGKGADIHTQSQLVRATDEEVAEAKRKLAFDQFAKGDKVRLVSGGNDHPLLGFDNGDMCEVVSSPCGQYHGGTRVHIKSTDGTDGFANPDQLAKLTEAESAENERKKAEEAKWATIGRKVGEFKVGDVVLVLDTITGANARKAGDIATITHFSDKTGNPHVGKDSVDYWAYTDPKHLELIAPVESTVNLRGGDAA